MSRTPETLRMERLVEEYEKAGDENLEDAGESTEQGARLLALQISFESWNVEDRGEARDAATPRFALEAKMLVRVDKIACELQLFVERASSLVAGRTRFFRVDPEDAILPILRGCGSLAQLIAAWEIMRKRLELGQGFFKKYLKEAKFPTSIVDFSPASTTTELKDSLAEHQTGDAQLRHLMAYYPHHNGSLRDHKDRLRVMSADWDTVIQLARGEEVPEEFETDTSYDSQYQMRPDNTSLFENDLDEEETVIEGKRKSVVEDEESLPDVSKAEQQMSFVDQLPKTVQTEDEVLVNTALMAPATPFKTPKQFLAGLVPVNIGNTKIPPAVPAPNVLKRLGVGPMGAVGDAYRSSFGKPDVNPGGREDTSDKPKADPLPPRPSNVFDPSANRSAPGGGGESGGGGGNGGGGGGGGGGSGRANSSWNGSGRYGFGRGPPIGGGSGGGDGGDDGGGNPLPPPGPVALVPTIDVKLKLADLPTWDGNHETAVKYFFEVAQKANLGGTIPELLGQWLGMRLKEGSEVQEWYAGLPGDIQAESRRHYITYLQVIKEHYLGRPWQRRMNREYELQRFRQKGFEDEKPRAYIGRRIMWTRMLVATDDGGPGEVYHIMEKAPVSWGPILILENIRSTLNLYSKVVEHEAALIHSARSEHSKGTITTDNLGAALRALGFEKPKYTPRQAHYTSGGGGATNADSQSDPVEEEKGGETQVEDAVFRQVYTTLKARTCPPPPGGYPFPKNDHVVTKLGKPPPGPCRLCGSEKHWNRECPNYVVYSEGVKRTANLATAQEPTEEETMYQTNVDLDALSGSFFESADLRETSGRKTAEKTRLAPASSSLNNDSDHNEQTHPSHGPFDPDTRPVHHQVNRKARIEEIPDEEEEEMRRKEKSDSQLLEPSIPEEDAPAHAEEDMPTKNSWQSSKRAREARKFSKMAEEFWLNDGRLFEGSQLQDEESDGEGEEETQEAEEMWQREGYMAEAAPAEAFSFMVHQDQTLPQSIPQQSNSLIIPPPSELKPVRLSKRRKTKPGLLSMKGMIGSVDGPLIDLRVDTCTDHYLTLTDRSPIQVEDNIQGYINTKVFAMTEEGVLIETEAEAYIVPGMSDWQLNYEIAVTRNVESGTKLHFQGWEYTIVNKHIRAKRHRTKLVRQKKKAAKFGEEKKIVRAAHNYKLRAHECRLILLEGYFEEDREWLVEKNLLANANDSYFAVGNTLISSLNPWLPPRMIRKGEALGTLRDPSEFFDKPSTTESRKKYEQAAEAMATIIRTNLKTEVDVRAHEAHKEKAEECALCYTEEADKTPPQTGPAREVAVEAEDYGPKTAAMPDPQDYASSQLRELIDVGTLPEELKEQAWRMLEKRVSAFGFDGRLGHHPAKVHIRTMDGQVPIASVERACGDRLPQREATVLRGLSETQRGDSTG
ncbi:hypothetical protein DFH06DRAFT_1266550 [Mycena polygramma]|nr:hypothetical protein DFH06DRAFT_1266550 [Mycena polygramma]